MILKSWETSYHKIKVKLYLFCQNDRETVLHSELAGQFSWLFLKKIFTHYSRIDRLLVLEMIIF